MEVIMTIKQCAKKRGIQSEINVLFRINTYDIDFKNSNGDMDETQLDASDVNELDELYAEFCKENGFKRNTVNSITIVESR